VATVESGTVGKGLKRGMNLRGFHFDATPPSILGFASIILLRAAFDLYRVKCIRARKVCNESGHVIHFSAKIERRTVLRY
jgi:hypothetical protein